MTLLTAYVSTVYPEDGGSTFLPPVGNYLPVDKASLRRRLDMGVVCGTCVGGVISTAVVKREGKKPLGRPRRRWG
jgi:hypothetical protein